jgi:hypothetical protein
MLNFIARTENESLCQFLLSKSNWNFSQLLAVLVMVSRDDEIDQ